jgi:hypothetical protein
MSNDKNLLNVRIYTKIYKDKIHDFYSDIQFQYSYHLKKFDLKSCIESYRKALWFDEETYINLNMGLSKYASKKSINQKYLLLETYNTRIIFEFYEYSNQECLRIIVSSDSLFDFKIQNEYQEIEF